MPCAACKSLPVSSRAVWCVCWLKGALASAAAGRRGRQCVALTFHTPADVLAQQRSSTAAQQHSACGTLPSGPQSGCLLIATPCGGAVRAPPSFANPSMCCCPRWRLWLTRVVAEAVYACCCCRGVAIQLCVCECVCARVCVVLRMGAACCSTPPASVCMPAAVWRVTAAGIVARVRASRTRWRCAARVACYQSVLGASERQAMRSCAATASPLTIAWLCERRLARMRGCRGACMCVRRRGIGCWWQLTPGGD
jgi:hypothetical protein